MKFEKGDKALWNMIVVCNADEVDRDHYEVHIKYGGRDFEVCACTLQIEDEFDFEVQRIRREAGVVHDS